MGTIIAPAARALSEHAWCPKCAAFQSASNAACEKCGVSMRRLPKPISWPARFLTTLAVLFFSIIFIAIFHGAAILILLAIGTIVTIGTFAKRSEDKKLAAMTPQESAHYVAQKQQAEIERAAQKQRERAAKEPARLQRAYGPLNPSLICPHCQAKGMVRTRQEDMKTGISGGKATAAVLTGGFSLLATGLSRTQQVTAARCGECGSAWTF
jgi:uncharacterized paraquat-inducible protein A